ncbi:MAG: EAL domain-containing protein [Bauldia sp.]
MAWLKSNVTEAEIAIVAGAVAAFLLLSRLDTFEWYYEETRIYENWQLDELANAFVVGTVALAIILFLRSRRLTAEVRRRVAAEAEASALARHDPLTGIANRRLFNERLTASIAAARRSGARAAVLSLDLNRFKAVNDTHGHMVGDNLLIAITERLRPLVRSDDSFARLGGDEFALAVFGVDREHLVRLANRIIAALDEPFDIGQIRTDTGVSIGISLFPEDGGDGEALIRKADMAMYRTKAIGVSGYSFFDAAIDEALRDRAALEVELRSAVGTDAITPFYQPQVNLDDGRITGFEMLARWQHPTRGLLLPEVFIPIAEDARLIGDLSLALLRRAVDDAKRWDGNLALSINIAPDQFKDPMLAAKILGVLEVAAFPANRLEIELTETALLDDLAGARRIIEDLKRAGVRVAIDDFGKGYSSLYYLRELPFDVVKIDRSFVTTRRANVENAKIVSAVIGLSEALGIATVAEGIEEAVDAAWLREQGCNTGQGFLYSVPVPAGEVPALLAKRLAA